MRIEHFHDILLFFENEILLKDLNGLLVYFLILDQLELLNLIDEPALLRDNNHRVLRLLVHEVFLAALQDEIAPFKSHNQRSWVS